MRGNNDIVVCCVQQVVHQDWVAQVDPVKGENLVEYQDLVMYHPPGVLWNLALGVHQGQVRQ